MAQLIVRNLDEQTKSRLQRRARRHGRSTEEEVREILRTAVGVDEQPPRALGSAIASRFRGIGIDEDIPKLPRQPARPARFRR